MTLYIPQPIEPRTWALRDPFADTDDTNTDRRRHNARQVLDVYANRPGGCFATSGTDEDYACDLTDLLADLLHLADEIQTDHGLLGIGAEGTAASALNHYRAERSP
jgi:hypothetical protein